MYIKLKEGADIEALNGLLEKLNINGFFVTEKWVQDWADDINTNPNSCQKHLKPKDRDITVADLKAMFQGWTEVGLFERDLYFGRTEQDEMQRIAQFIVQNKEYIEYLDGSNLLIERGDLKPRYHDIINSLEKPHEEPEKLPVEQQYLPNLQGGILLCKSWGLEPFWVVFGNVKNPRFMKTKIYKDELYNNLYKDSNGYGYMLIPQMPIGKEGFVEEVYNNAWELGLREEPNFFLSIVYGLSVVDTEAFTEQLYGFYSLEELKERFKLIAKKITDFAKTPNCFGLLNGKLSSPYTYCVPSRYNTLISAMTNALEKHLGIISSATFGKFVFEKETIVI